MKLDSPKKISQALKRFGVKQTDFAKEIGFSFVHTNKCLRGVCPIVPERLELFASTAARMIADSITDAIDLLEKEKGEIDIEIKELENDGRAFWSNLLDDEEREEEDEEAT
jgi:hypothetical protein